MVMSIVGSCLLEADAVLRRRLRGRLGLRGLRWVVSGSRWMERVCVGRCGRRRTPGLFAHKDAQESAPTAFVHLGLRVQKVPEELRLALEEGGLLLELALKGLDLRIGAHSAGRRGSIRGSSGGSGGGSADGSADAVRVGKQARAYLGRVARCIRLRARDDARSERLATRR